MHKEDIKKLNDIFWHMKHPSEDDRKLIERAYTTAQDAHKKQKRASGTPYFEHVYATALTLAELGMGASTIAAGFLHDTVEDGHLSYDVLREQFGEDIVFLVDGVTKLGKLKYRGMERHVESLRKLFIAMSQDVRVILIRLADRLHNMQTLKFLPPEKQKRIADETLHIYAPIAHRLGIGKLKGQLEDLAFPVLFPQEFEQTKEILEEKSTQTLKELENVADALTQKLAEVNITDVTINYRVKHLYSLYRKLKKHDMNIDRVYDIAALRLIVPSVEDCYMTLGIVHSEWRPLPGRIKDYIAIPKPNGYKSLHTTVFTGDGTIIEIQIRTPHMHQEAEYGVASHVRYKEGSKETHSSFGWLQKLLGKETKDNVTLFHTQSEHVEWVQELAETQNDISGAQTFIRSLKNDFFNERIFVFTPDGEVVDLPVDATPVDFAYAIHTDLGNQASGAKINGKFGALSTKLTNGDIVYIETKKNGKPSQKWLKFVKTNFAKRKIRASMLKDS